MKTPQQVVAGPIGIRRWGYHIAGRLYWLTELGWRTRLEVQPKDWGRTILGRIWLVRRGHFKGRNRRSIPDRFRQTGTKTGPSRYRSEIPDRPLIESPTSLEIHTREAFQDPPSASSNRRAAQCHNEPAGQFIAEAPNLPCASDTTTNCGGK